MLRSSLFHLLGRSAASGSLMAFPPATTVAAAGMALTPQCTMLPGARRHFTIRGRAAICRAAPTAERRGARKMAWWRQVQGCHNWEGLLLQSVVRSELARYGELVDACYKAFDLDPSSRRYLNCKHGKDRMLQEVGMAGAGYEVTKYIYATPDVMSVPTMDTSTGRWIGYVAVSTDEMTRRQGRRDVLVSFRGTVTPAEWMANQMISLAPARFDPCDPRPDVKVETGFLGLYTSADKTCRLGGAGSCREQLLREVSRLNKDSSTAEGASVTIAGHSMGGALALLFAYDLAELGLNRTAPVTVFSFGGPRVGNAAFKARCDKLGVKALRVANVPDPVMVSRLPGVFLNEAMAAGARLRTWHDSSYTHVGVELPLDFFNFGNVGAVHDLGTYIAAFFKVRKVLEFVDRQQRVGGTMPLQDAALQVGRLVQTLGLI
ncbi:unnamed protein product [Alopecurus aequalis]